MAAPKDSIDPALLPLIDAAGTRSVVVQMNALVRGSAIGATRLQAPASYRVIPQVHGALLDAWQGLRQRIESTFRTFSDNPVMVGIDAEEGGRFLSHGGFHDQHQ